MEFDVEKVSQQEIAQAMISLAIEGISITDESGPSQWTAFSEFVNNNEHLFHCDFLADDGSEEAACRLCQEVFYIYEDEIKAAWID